MPQCVEAYSQRMFVPPGPLDPVPKHAYFASRDKHSGGNARSSELQRSEKCVALASVRVLMGGADTQKNDLQSLKFPL
jgi:hypothetical protein